MFFLRHSVVAGKLFHTRGPATAKLLSPRVVRVRGTASVLYRKMSGDDDDHAQRRVECRQRVTSVLLTKLSDRHRHRAECVQQVTGHYKTYHRASVASCAQNKRFLTE